MARPPNVGRINTRISMPSAEKQKELERKASQVVDPDEGWLQLLSDEDIRTPSDLFRDPPEKLVAKTDYDSLVYGWLIEDRLDGEDNCLVYLMKEQKAYSVVYVFAGRCHLQRCLLSKVTGKPHMSDMRVLPDDSPRMRLDAFVQMKSAWEAWVFHHYFGFEWFPEGDYWD